MDFAWKYAKKAYNKLRGYATLVMFSHTVFSLSFAVVALLAASNGRPQVWTLFWATLALLSARTGANALNRAVDARIDAKNPRTASRQIPRGEVSVKETLLLTAACFAVLVVSAAMLNPLCAWLSPFALFLMTIYSYTKRFTYLCHLVLGITCACAPVGAWLAVTGAFSFEALLLGAANCLWVAGFDIIYGCQDYDFDVENRLHSFPVKFGVEWALRFSGFFHVLALIFLAMFILFQPLMGPIVWVGFFIICGLVALQHAMIKPGKLDNVNLASYSVSQVTAVVLLLFGVLDVYL